MPINLKTPQLKELKPHIVVCGVGGAGGNAVNNMIASGLSGVDFIVANTDAQALASCRAERIIQMGLQVTEGLGAGAKPEVGKAAAEEALEEICDHLAGSHMIFLTAVHLLGRSASRPARHAVLDHLLGALQRRAGRKLNESNGGARAPGSSQGH
jgi:cell division GTPase FtsZ